MNESEYKTPGQLIAALLKERGWSNRVLALVLGVKDPVVSKMVSGKRPVDAAMAVLLEEVFSVSAERFVGLQSSYDLAKARIEVQPDSKRATRAHIYGELPVPEMVRRGWINVDDPRDSDLLETELCRFFRVNRIEDAGVFSFAAKQTDASTEATAAQLAWLHRVKMIASGMLIGSYSPQSLEIAISKIKLLRSHPEHMERVPRILAEAGVRFVIVETLPSAKIDGVCFWLNERSPVIGMTLRFDRIDNFLFVLRHELEHVRRRDGLTSPVLDIELDGSTDSTLEVQEREANKAAQEFCVPEKMMNAFIARKAPYFSERDLLGFAKTLKVHPGLVAGQLQRRTGQYNKFRSHLAKVREFVAPAAEVDGWGDIHPIES